MNHDTAISIIQDDSATLEAKVEAASHLWNLIETCTRGLDQFKELIRPIAAANGKSPVTFSGHELSQCRVVLSTPQLNLVPGLTLVDQRKALGLYFDDIFDVQLRLRSSDPKSLDRLPPPIREIMSKVTTVVTNPARVSLLNPPGVINITPSE